MSVQVSTLQQKRHECGLLALTNDSAKLSNGSHFCGVVWDGILCWDHTLAGVLRTQRCPTYIYDFNEQEVASKLCTANGTWYVNQNNVTWSNYTRCNIPVEALETVAPSMPAEWVTLLSRWLPVVKTMSQVGYGVSFVTLVVALCILSAMKKLRCPRNSLHKHLFFSFIMRAFMALLKDFLFVEGLGLPSNVDVDEDGISKFNTENYNWECKLFTSLWQYFIMANYSWILMEGMYLHNLIFMALFSDSSSISIYIGVGWGVPALFVLPWAVSRSQLEDNYCWTTNNTHLFLLIRVPIIISVLMSFGLFVNIMRVLLMKLQCSLYAERRRARYSRFARSTLVLVPLFGVHYAVFLGMSYSIGRYPRVELAWLFCDQFFASFQGLFVSLLYCLLNAEVRCELARKWWAWRASRGRTRRGGSLSSNYAPDIRIRMNGLGREVGALVDSRVRTISGSEDDRFKYYSQL